EELHAAVLGALVDPALETPSRIRAVVLPARGDLANLLGSNVGGVYFRAKYDHQPTILFSADSVNRLPQVLAHELAAHVVVLPLSTPEALVCGRACSICRRRCRGRLARTAMGGRSAHQWVGRGLSSVAEHRLPVHGQAVA